MFRNHEVKPENNIAEDNEKENCLRNRHVERDKEGKLILYHVTTARNFAMIQKDKSLKPARDTANRTWRLKQEEGRKKIDKIYLATSKVARDIATMLQKSKGGSIYVLEVHIDENDLEPDEDSRENTWYKSLSGLGTCASYKYIGNYRLAKKIDFQLPLQTKRDFFNRASHLQKDGSEEQALLEEMHKLAQDKEKEENAAVQKILSEKN